MIRPEYCYFFTSLFIAVASLFQFYRTKHVYDFYFCFFLFITFAQFFFSIYLLIKKPFHGQKISALSLKFIFILLALAIFSRFYGLNQYSIWLDEDTQVQFAVGMSSNIIEAAATEQQPPLGYLLTFMSNKIFGYTELGARFFPAFLCSLGVVFFFLILLQLTGRPSYSFLGSLVYTFNPWLIRFAQEARPLPLSIFFELLYIYFFIHCLRSKKISAYFALVGIIWLFLCSVGFQPVLIIAFAIVILLPFLLHQLARPYVGRLIGAHLAGLLLYLPFQWLMLQMGIRLHKFKTISLEHIFEVLSHVKWLEKFHNFFALFISFHWLAILFLSASLITMAVRIHWGIGFQKMKVRDLLLLGLSAFCLGFPFLFVGIFEATINWSLFLKYYLDFLPIVAIGLFFAYYCIFRLHRKSFQGFSYILYFQFIMMMVGLPKVYDSQWMHYYERWNSDWRGVYQILRESGHRGDIAHIIFAGGIGLDLDRFLCYRFYYRSDDPVKLYLSDSDTTVKKIYEDYIASPSPRNLFLVIHQPNELFFNRLKDFYSSEKLGIKFFVTRDFIVLKLDVHNDFKILMDRHLNILSQQLAEMPEAGVQIWAALAKIYAHENKMERARLYSRKVREIDKPGHYDKFLSEASL